MTSDIRFNSYFRRCISCIYWLGDVERGNKLLSKLNTNDVSILYDAVYGKCSQLFNKLELEDTSCYCYNNEPVIENSYPMVPSFFGCVFHSLMYGEILDINDI